MAELQWVSTPDSSRTSAVAYDAENMRIHCRWASGGEGYYEGADVGLWHEFMASGSKGKFIERRLKGSLPYSRA